MSWSLASFAAIDVGTVGSSGVLGALVMAVVKVAVDERKGRKERRRGSIRKVMVGGEKGGQAVVVVWKLAIGERARTPVPAETGRPDETKLDEPAAMRLTARP